MRLFVLPLAALALACNSAPKNSCAPSTDGVVSAGQSPATCAGACVDAGSVGAVCLVDCTDAGEPACVTGTQCAAYGLRSYCWPACAYPDAGDAGGVCFEGLTCTDAGACTP